MAESRPKDANQFAARKIFAKAKGYSANFVLHASILTTLAYAFSTGSIDGNFFQVFGIGVGVNLLSDLINRLARGEKENDETISQTLQNAIAQSDLGSLLTDDKFRRNMAWLFARHENLLAHLISTSEQNLLDQLQKNQLLTAAGLKAIYDRLGQMTTKDEQRHAEIMTWLRRQLPDSLTFPITNLPPANPHFTGRQHLLEAMQTALENQATTITITQAITGLGGVGKTQLALEFAHRHRHNYDLIWWLNATDATQLDNALQLLGQRLRLPLPPDDLPAARQHVLSWLSSTDRRWLLIYDNVDSLTPRELHPYRPGSPGHALITSRNPHWQAQASVLNINVFTPQEAADFFQQRLGLADEPSLRQLAEALGYLPLALEHAAAYLETREIAAAAYLELFQKRRQELWTRIDPPDAYHATITTTWNIGFEQAQKVLGAADLLALCCFLAPDDIPLHALAGSFTEVQPLAEAGLADDLLRADALAVLRQYGLLTGPETSLSLHRLVQTVYRDQMEEEAARTWLAAAVDLLIAVLPDWTRLHEWAMGQRILPHLVTANHSSRELVWETERAALLANWTGYYLDFLADYAAARPYYERALAIREKVLGAEHPDTATSLNNLGFLLYATGDYAAARPHFERALAIREKVLGAEHPDTASSLNNLGLLLYATGDYAAAGPYFERAMAILEKVLGAEHPDTARSLNNLGALLDSTGDYAAARPYYERALAICEKVLGAEHPDTATSLNNLGFSLYATGDYAAARPHFERALAIREKVLGAEHPDTATSLSNLGALLDSTGDYAAARPYYERALAICEKVLGAEHPDTARSLNNLGALLDSTGDYAAARPYYERALAIREKVLGAEHPDTARSLNNLGFLLRATGNYAAARPYYERALAIWEKALGPNHPHTQIVKENLATLNDT